jgi:hypothetical protein
VNEKQFFLVHLGLGMGRGTGSEEFISTSACGTKDGGEYGPEAVFTSAYVTRTDKKLD